MFVTTITSQNNQNKSISFTSKIKLLSSREMRSVLNNGGWWEFCRINQIIRGEKVRTNGVKYCIAGGLANNTSATMFHIFPDRCEKPIIHDLETRLNAQVRNPKGGLIVGGYSSHTNSQNVFTRIKTYFQDKLGNNFSYFFGHNREVQSNDTQLAYDAYADTWYVTNKFIDKQIRKQHPKNSEELRAILDEAFDDVYISSNDKLVM